MDFDQNKNNIFLQKCFHQSFLLNPPYEDYPEQLSENPIQPLRNHVKHILEVSIQSEKTQVIMVPNLKGKKWFDKVLQHPFITPVFLQTPLIFLRGKDLILHGVAQFQSVLLITGLYSPVNIYAKNNCMGHFLFKNKLFANFESVFQLPKLTSNISILANFFAKTEAFCQNAHAIFSKNTPKFKQIEHEQDFKKYSL